MNLADRQTAADVMMIRPVAFAGNPQTQPSNSFQQLDSDGGTIDAASQAAALREFDALVGALRQAGVNVHVFDDTPEPHTPDSIFPNNWVSFHADGTVVLYPMLAENRRLERRLDLLEALSAKHGFYTSRVIDLTRHEHTGRYLEGTGSLVLDRIHRVAYACVSPRTDLDVLGDFAQQLDYDIVAFEALDAAGAPIYHTNVLMSVGERFAAVCLNAIREDEREGVVNQLRGTGRAIVELSLDQMNAFAGNMLELASSLTGSVVAMSQRARDALTAEQRATLEASSGPIVTAAIPTIERLGGGSVRCMLAELHLPSKKPL
ncbi:MAG TPA: arginine deiminase-related protein [Steroidobacter sp.]|uniref:citrulline utilization hydrolase CtlX n=1 Tax=Steroidobacter sp. TaxID=1978227 RepID=UPI002ED7B3CA